MFGIGVEALGFSKILGQVEGIWWGNLCAGFEANWGRRIEGFDRVFWVGLFFIFYVTIENRRKKKGETKSLL